MAIKPRNLLPLRLQPQQSTPHEQQRGQHDDLDQSAAPPAAKESPHDGCHEYILDRIETAKLPAERPSIDSREAVDECERVSALAEIKQIG